MEQSPSVTAVPPSRGLVLPVRPPNGTSSARLDLKGRLTPCTALQEYLNGFAEKKFFCTSFDGLIGQIIPMTVWDEYAFYLDNHAGQVGRDVLWTAQEYGQDAEMDSQGRITFPAELRRTLGLEGKELRLLVVRGRIEVLTPEQHGLRRAKMNNKTSTVETLETGGMGQGIRFQ